MWDDEHKPQPNPGVPKPYPTGGDLDPQVIINPSPPPTPQPNPGAPKPYPTGGDLDPFIVGYHRWVVGGGEQRG